MRLFLTLALSIIVSSYSFAGIDLNGDADYVSIPDDDAFTWAGLNDFTMCVWFNPDAHTGARNWLLTKGAASNYEWALYVDSSSNVEFEAWTLAGSQIVNFSGGTISNGTWYHVCIAYDHSATTYDLYIDGSRITGTVDSSATSNGTSEVRIGARGDGAATYWNGKIGEANFWTGYLSGSDVSNLYDSKIKGMAYQIQPSSLIAYLPLDDEPHSGAIDTKTFADRSATGNDGTGTDSDGDSTAYAEEVLSYP